MRLLPLLGLVSALAISGCSKGTDVVGRWNFPLPNMVMDIEFKSDGTYSGSAMGGMAQVTGTYKTSGKHLIMEPPTITGPNGSTTPPGGQMRMEMRQLSPTQIELSAPNLKFVMSKL